ncbi:hypothetical protein HBI56_090430 [Parastagonospora nodorum]|uniref:Fe2OG dioxygenase domain-containing protein n=2 Tax=Phaeosphaeria nodorum (strain SN15 / ATCC MYA-4574 / FGSC 10173) TaxID=321614 RepID=A0A7U2I4N5_PHANO|nr:hypothetical protein SNOG_10015 [Parastagonospora nodorum SN15]KAH3912907.1 hypothetical protein HBH56_109050 [Parastagonospora nodorum]EAT82350.1 hypothetical protein SNOG_10015 [Parastagonospora nodorum SN15]KAH3922302.1 hypothetical protein HBH54_226150 [Parastagonospora nodorum]KAH3951179.1 hypothetical protein HBH53_064790 [Parastagonospora nodorum]KAH3974375.1 hypothetical protein HBH51_093490 [Parastagonospora nodorum]
MSQSTIPVIDISSPSPEVAQQVLSAASTHGFLFIKNDGRTIPQKDIDEMFSLSKSFFSTPFSQKSAYAIHTPSAGGPNRGWVRMSGEALDAQTSDPKEAFNIGPPHPCLQPLPAPLSSHTELITRFQKSCHALCVSILSLLGTALEVSEEDYFASRHDEESKSGTIFRMLYYPKTSSASPTSIRAGAHSDYGSLTLLFRLPGQAGLELLTPSGWTSVPVDPSPSPSPSSPPILVNIGDLLCYWTNGMLKSTVHRVTFGGGEERYSMAYFCHPGDEVRLEGVESRVIRAFGDKGREELEGQRERLGIESGDEGVITAKEHLERRLKVTYGL